MGPENFQDLEFSMGHGNFQWHIYLVGLKYLQFMNGVKTFTFKERLKVEHYRIQLKFVALRKLSLLIEKLKTEHFWSQFKFVALFINTNKYHYRNLCLCNYQAYEFHHCGFLYVTSVHQSTHQRMWQNALVFQGLCCGKYFMIVRIRIILWEKFMIVIIRIVLWIWYSSDLLLWEKLI